MDLDHGRQPQIIRLLAVAWLVTQAAGHAYGQTPAAACVPCLALSVDAASLAGAEALPAGALQGLRVLLPPVGTAESTIGALSRAGALVGRTVGTGTDLTEGTLRPFAFVVVEPPQETGSSTQQRIFEARTTITKLRARGPHLSVVLDADAFGMAGVDVEAIAPYADALIGKGHGWARLREAISPDVEALTAASMVADRERQLLAVQDFDWHVAAEFVARGATTVDVSGVQRLTVEEILARYQARQRRQDEIVQTVTAAGTTTVLFELPGFSAPVTITADTTLFRDRDGARLEERNIRVNGAAITGGDARSAPRLPLVEAERIGTPPLAITLDDAYAYRLDGTDDVEGNSCYVVTFEPRLTKGSSAHGRAWIHTATFTLRRLEVVQEGLPGPIVISQQVDQFGPVDLGDDVVWLPRETRIFQRYEGAGIRTPIHRTMSLTRYEINRPDFLASLSAALDSDNVMLQETGGGLRYLVRRSEGQSRAIEQGAGNRVRSLVTGVLIDPNITKPLPFVGLSYANLNLFNRGAQVNAFFGGTVGQVAWTVPSVFKSRWQLHGSGFAIAAQYNDRVFRNGREQYDQNLAQRPARITAGLVRPLRARLHATIDYEFDATTLDRTSSTSPLFRVPSAVRTHGLTFALDLDRGAWGLRGWWNPARRQGWQPWGLTGQLEPSGADYQRFGAQVTRTLALRSSLSSRVQATWMGGRHLDRFSRYSVDAFDNQLHGYPTASIRYDRGAMLRSATTWSVRGVRLAGFGDLALVHDAGWDERMRSYPGVGAGVETGGPFQTLWSIEWGYGFRASRPDGGYGTQAARITLYRAF